MRTANQSPALLSLRRNDYALHCCAHIFYILATLTFWRSGAYNAM